MLAVEDDHGSDHLGHRTGMLSGLMAIVLNK